MPNKFTVASVQTDVHVASEDDPSSVKRAIEANLKRNMELVDYLAMDSRYGPKLICFSEFCLTGVAETRQLSGYELFAQPIPGMATDIIGESARKHSVYIVCNMFEKDDDWPGRIFNTSYLIGPDGDILIRYRKNNDFQVGLYPPTNPGEVYTEYIEKYGGPKSLFPVVETDIGKIGLMTCFDIRFAEVPRMLALQGAEIIVHPTGEAMGGPSRELWDMTKQVRAYDNMVYFISTNNGRTLGGRRPEFRQRGESRIIDYTGKIIAQTDGSGESLVTATVDLDALREARASNYNALTTSRFKTYLPIYEEFETWPLDEFSDEPIADRTQAHAIRERVVEGLYDRGVYTRPDPRVPADKVPRS